MVAPIPVFLDSPLAIKVTEIYRKYPEYLKDEVQAQIRRGDDIFDFPKLSLTRTTEDSAEIAKVHGAKIIIAGSGMSHGGRILGHEQRYLEDPKTTLLLVGYQAVGSLGRLLQDGARKVRILNAEVRVRAQIAEIRGYSGHADRDQLVDLVAAGSDHAQRIFVTMGEERSSLFLVQRLRDYLGLNAVAPGEGEKIDIDM
jgi:metallo-beta-lactamase family protein